MEPDFKEVLMYALIALSLPFVTILIYMIFKSQKYEDQKDDYGSD